MIKNIFFEQVKSFKTEQSSVGTLFQSNLKHQQSLENYHRTQKHDQKQVFFEKVESFKTEQSSVGNLFQSNLKHVVITWRVRFMNSSYLKGGKKGKTFALYLP